MDACSPPFDTIKYPAVWMMGEHARLDGLVCNVFDEEARE
jgi:hypothetical protein